MNFRTVLDTGSLMLRGFSLSGAETWLRLKKLHLDGRVNAAGVTNRRLCAALPLDAGASLLFGDALTTAYVLSDHSAYLPEYYAALLTRNGEPFVLPLFGREAVDPISLLRQKGSLLLREAQNAPDGAQTQLSCRDNAFFADGEPISERELTRLLQSCRKDSLLMEQVGEPEEPTLHIALDGKGTLLFALLTRDADAPCRTKELARVDAQGYYERDGERRQVAGFAGVLEKLREIMSEFRELSYLDFSVRFCADGFRIVRVDTGEELTYLHDTGDFLNERLRGCRRGMSPAQFMRHLWLSYWVVAAKRHGFLSFMYRHWREALWQDRLSPRTTLREKRWAHRRGFLSHRIAQYGLTEENYRDCLSDRDYRWLRPINNHYSKWLEDKVTVRYVLEKYRHCLPEYYYRVLRRDGAVTALPLPDCPADYGDGLDELLRLLRQRGALALKRTVGSHGLGFCKLAFENGTYFVNGVAKTQKQMLHFLRTLKTEYNVSEYIVMHPELRKICDGVACTVRLMVINRTGNDPVMENAYFRIGTSHTGFTDNIGSGGIFAYVDAETGRFHDAELLRGHVFAPCAVHPDSGAPIEGVLPHWNELRDSVVRLARYLSPLEYLGFDGVITEDGFRILEINTHQDLHKYPAYPESVHRFFEQKVALKKQGKRLA